MQAIKENGRALQFANELLKNDKEVVMEAIKLKGWALEYTSESLKNDKNVVMLAVKKTGNALQYASESLKNDMDVVKMAIVKGKLTTFDYVGVSLINNSDVVLLFEKNVNILSTSNTLLFSDVTILYQ